MTRIFVSAVFLCLLGSLAHADDKRGINEALNAFHTAAAEADLATYLGLLTPDIVFLGTDGNERWHGQEFREFVSFHFNKGRGWTYTMVERHSSVAPSGRAAWFDELLDNEAYGRCRGSGVLLKGEDGWRISQYNLSVPIPNAMLKSVAQDIRSLEE